MGGRTSETKERNPNMSMLYITVSQRHDVTELLFRLI